LNERGRREGEHASGKEKEEEKKKKKELRHEEQRKWSEDFEEFRLNDVEEGGLDVVDREEERRG
jgi:hypothetical protein